jgi:hypothetical protein
VRRIGRYVAIVLEDGVSTLLEILLLHARGDTAVHQRGAVSTLLEILPDAFGLRGSPGFCSSVSTLLEILPYLLASDTARIYTTCFNPS